MPGLARVALLWNPDARGTVLDHKDSEAAATSLHLVLYSREVSSAADLDRAFSDLMSQHAQALIVPPRYSRRVREAGRDCQLCPEKPVAVRVWAQGVRGCGRAHALWAQPKSVPRGTRHVASLQFGALT
jgi:hypothetical protein